MTKGKKGKSKNYKLRRQLRRTVGCLFMISAMIVAAVPVQPTEAATEWDTVGNPWITAADLPYEVKDGDTVYYSSDGVFRFAYTGEGNNKFAVIAGYDLRFLEGNRLTIPNEVDAYIQYTDTDGTDKGFVAASKDGSPLFYKVAASTTRAVPANEVIEPVLDADGNVIVEDNQIVTQSVPEPANEITPRAVEEYRPCTVDEYSSWHSKNSGSIDESGNPIIEDVQLYYHDGTVYQPIENGGDDKQRIKAAKIRYISGNSATVHIDEATKKHTWTGVAPANRDTGVFAGDKGGNIVTLMIGKDLLGIGNYAFYGCTNLAQINLSNGLTTVGNYAFANCTRMTVANIDLASNLTILGDHAFSNCRDLPGFSMPYSVRQIGDSCFENCSSLQNIYLVPEIGGSVSLESIGYKAFENCSSLQYLELPASYNGSTNKDYVSDGVATRKVFHLSTVKGCTSLAYITTPSKDLDLVYTDDVDGTYSYAQFRNEMPAAFYLEAPGYKDTLKEKRSGLHKTANEQHIAFSYLEEKPNPGKYEIVNFAQNDDGTVNKKIELIFAVNNADQLTAFSIVGNKENVPNITLPEVIGPHNVSEINEGSFSDNCYVRKITLPKSLHIINSNAFKGCHELKHIIFNDATGITSIGNGAFDTQVVSDRPKHECGMDLEDIPYLSFSGAIVDDQGKNTQPYVYAMKSTSNINRGTQPTTYITYFSGWPTNLTIRHNYDTGMAELIDYPTKDEVEAGFVYTHTSTPSSQDSEIYSNGYEYPYITADYSAAAKTALSAYEAWKTGGPQPTEDKVKIAESTVYNMVIPAGVTAIKTGLFSGIKADGTAAAGTTKNDELKAITLMSVENVEPRAFSNLAKLETFNMNGGTSLGDYAFDNCDKLANVSIGPSVMTLGIRPFKACDILTDVSIPTSDYLACEEAVIYGKTNGVKTKIIECLETRGAKTGSTTAGPEEFAEITEISPEAFMNCDGIGEIDLSTSKLKSVPERCFADYEKDPDNPTQAPRDNRLGRVVLPSGATDISKGAFWNSNVYTVVVPSSVTYIEPNAFSYTKGTAPSNPDVAWSDSSKTPLFDDSDHSLLTFICQNGTPATVYAGKYDYINTKETDDLKARFTVNFYDAFDQTKPVQIGTSQLVIQGEDATPPTPPEHAGYVFANWYPADGYKAVARNVDISAMYEPVGAITHEVKFVDWDDKVLDTQQVVQGENAKEPASPVREGWLFTGWRPGYTNVQTDLTVYAQYEKEDADSSKFTVTFYSDDKAISTQKVAAGEGATEPSHPTKTGYTFSGWLPATAWQNVTKDLDVYAQFTAGNGSSDNPGGNGNNGNNGSNGNNSDSSSGNSVSGNSTKYKVVVNGGSGGGEYTAGTIVSINAYFTSDGKSFDKWTSASSGVGFVNANAASTNFTMPSNSVEITATFKNGGDSSVSNNSRNTLRNSTTTVDVTKSGISNKDLATANVNGSSGNYIVKITEDASATAEVIAALQAKYGDLTNIAYLPMDISLYDSTGQNKITTTGGITVDITLPLPDELVQYAGNNQAGSVNNGVMEDLNESYTTINNVPCVQFTAVHFSPYAIYVDKGNLTEGTVDATPKTGDPIHPKWFLAIGLACISVILFCKKDKMQKKVKTA